MILLIFLEFYVPAKVQYIFFPKYQVALIQKLQKENRMKKIIVSVFALVMVLFVSCGTTSSLGG